MNKQLLIVDDDDAVRILIAGILKKQGYECSVAEDAFSARELLKKNLFDLILCDIIMPGESGLDLIRFCSEEYPDMGAIMVTGVEDPQSAKEVSNIGAYGYVIKPFANNQLVITVDNALRRCELERAQRRESEKLEIMVRQRTAELQKSESKFRIAIEQANDGVAIVRDRKYIYANQNFLKMFGYEREDDIIGFSMTKIIHPDETMRLMNIHHRRMKGEKVPTRYIFKGLQTSGESIMVEVSVSRVDYQGKEASLNFFRDVTESNRIQREVIKEHREKEQLIKSIPSILMGVTLEGLVGQFNPFSEKVFGISAKDILGRPFFQCGIQWDWARVNAAVADCLKSNDSISLEKVHFTGNDGKEGFLGITITPVESPEPDRPGFLIMGADITNRIMLELQLDQARKLEAIGQLAAGIAHEINTPTQYVGDNIRFFQDAFKDMEPLFQHYKGLTDRLLEEDVNQIVVEEIENNIMERDMDYLLEEIPQALEQTLEGVARVSTIVRSMKEFSHPGAKEKTAVDINRAIENTVTVSRNEWKYVARLEMDLDPQLPHVSCLPAELNQVILNLITNAAHAIGDGLGGCEGEKGVIRIRTCAKENSIEIQISDTGAGIPEEIQTRIFDPFFTTKEVGKGTGQGLAISHSVIVDKHGGSLFFKTQKGNGTSFFIHLPIQ